MKKPIVKACKKPYDQVMNTIDLFKVFMSKEAMNLAQKVLGSGYVGQGQMVEEFEMILRKHFNSNYVNTVNSATSGLQLVLHTLNIDGGNEVLTTPLSCLATNTSIIANRLNIKWVDIDPNTLNIDYDDLERKLSPKTKAIMIVHWGGYSCDLDRLKEIQLKCLSLYGFEPAIIEDCAHAWGAKYREKLVGEYGNNYKVFSFQAIKHFNTVDGGLIISPNEEHYKRVKLLRWYGLDRTSSLDFRCSQNVIEPGFKYHMADLNAAIGVGNYPHIEKLVELHRKNGEYYNKHLKNVNGITLLENKEHVKSSYWIYSMLVENRSAFIKKMKENHIVISQVHNRNDLHSCFKQFQSALPNLDRISDKMICIPVGHWIVEEEREYITDRIMEGW